MQKQTRQMVLATLIAAGLAGTSATALAARMFCCTDDRGKQSCGDVLPPICQTRAYNEFNERGQKVRAIEAPLTESQQAARDEETKKKRETDRLALEQKRRDQALLSTYAAEKDLDTARDRAVAEVERSIKQTQDKLEAANKIKTKLTRDLEFYKNKPVPAQLKEDIRRNEADVKAQQANIDLKRKEIEELKARFEADRARLKELRGEKKAEGEAAAPAAKP